jgi:parallel beta-helix repeat protein
MILERMTFMVRVLVTVFIISFAMLGSTYGATYYVSKSGSNNNSCATAQSPGSTAKLTISAGASCMSGGDTLLIQAGTYTEAMAGDVGFPWRSGTPSNYTRYARYQKDIVTLRPTSGNYVVIFTEPDRYIEFDGFILDGGGRGATVLKTDDTNTNVRIKNCVLKNVGPGAWPNQPMVTQIHGNNHELLNNDLSGSPSGYGIYLAGSNNIIDGNSVHDNGAHGIHAYSDVGGVNNNIFRNNRIYNNGFAGQSFGFSPGMILGSGNGNIAYNNLVYNNWGGIQIAYNGASNTQMYNNTIYNNTGGTSCIYNNSSASGTIIRNNICYQNNGGIVIEGGSSGVQQSNNLTSDPLFVNAANADFHLQVGSQAVDKGVTISTVINDSDGKPRPQGAAFDIGAYEYRQGLSQPTNFRVVSSN